MTTLDNLACLPIIGLAIRIVSVMLNCLVLLLLTRRVVIVRPHAFNQLFIVV